MKSLFLSLLLVFSMSAMAASKGIDVTVNLSPAGSFHITSKKIKGKLKAKGKGYIGKEISIKVKSFKTGIDLRDEHTKKRLSPKKHPKIIVTKVTAKGGKGKGVIKIKGTKKPFKFTYSVKGKLMMAEFKLNLKHFKLKDLTYLGVGAKDMVEIKANIPIK